MKDLYRGLAPISSDAWDEIEEEARSALKVTLAARKLVDFTGPLGWSTSAVDLGRAAPLSKAPGKGVQAALRKVIPLVEMRIPFQVKRSEIDAIARGAKDADLDSVRDAARAIALAEDQAVFHGYPEAGIVGIAEGAEQAALTISPDYESYPKVVAAALSTLKTNSVDGPYGIALGPRCYQGLTRTTTKAGYPVLQHVQELLDGPIVWAPGVDGAVVMSLRGGDFELTVGRDFSIGYLSHDAESVDLFIEESMTFQMLAPEAAVPLVYGNAKSRKGK